MTTAIAPSTRKLMKLAENALHKQRAQEAYQLYQQVLQLNPHHAEALLQLGKLLHGSGEYAAAALLYERAIQENPKHFESYKMLCLVYTAQNLEDKVLETAEVASQRVPEEPAAHVLMANTLARFNRVHLVPEYLEQVLPLFPSDVRMHQCYCAALKGCNRFEEADAQYQKITARLRVEPQFRVMFETMLPRFNQSNAHIDALREKFLASVEKFTKEKMRITVDQLASCPVFALAYHNRDNRQILAAYSNMLRAIIPELTYVAPHCKVASVDRQGPLHIGFISKHMHNHAVGLSYRGLFAHLAKQPDFKVTFFNLANVMDSGIQEILDAGISMVSVPLNIKAAQESVAKHKLDVLIYPDVGMDAFTHYLAMARLAPHQACLSGHPETTGIDTMDYVIASRTYEPENAQENYTERLLCLDGIGIIVKRPPKPTLLLSRRDFGLPEDKKLYLCPMAIQKFHPDFDRILAEILKKDDQAMLVLFADFQEETATEAFKNRLFSVCDPARIRFMPWLQLSAFQCCLQLADALLDTIYFGGGTTSLYAFGLGIPLVTMLARYARGRGVLSHYKAMGIEDAPIASSPEEYVALAIKIANDSEYRARLHEQIMERNDRLFEQKSEIDAYSQLIRDIVAQDLDRYS